MRTATISLEVDADTATTFSAAPQKDRNKLSSLWGVLVHEYQAATTPLQQVMDELGAKAAKRGLSPEKLASILEDE